MTPAPAFPTQLVERGGAMNRAHVAYYPGMTLRDYFAAHAQQALLTPGAMQDNHPDKVAAAAYKQADAMMRARSQP